MDLLKADIQQRGLECMHMRKALVNVRDRCIG